MGNDPWEMENKWCVSINASAYSIREFPGHGAQRGNQDRAYQITQMRKVELRTRKNRAGRINGINTGKGRTDRETYSFQSSPKNIQLLTHQHMLITKHYRPQGKNHPVRGYSALILLMCVFWCISIYISAWLIPMSETGLIGYVFVHL